MNTGYSNCVGLASNLVAGRWSVGSGPHLVNTNPTDRSDEIGVFSEADGRDLDRAVEAATFAAEEWGSWSPIRRARSLARVARAIESHAEEFARDLTREEGKTLPEAMAEVQRGVHVFDYYAASGYRLDGRLHPSDRPGFRIENRRTPLGVVAVISPWNFPFAIPAWKTAPALVSGNAVILKPSPLTPTSAVNLARAIESADIPEGLFQLLHGSGATLGAAIGTHPGIQAVSFTGSTSVGRALYLSTASVFKPMQAELGGHNPLVVTADADLDSAASIAVEGAFMSSGQKCTATRRVLVEDRAYDDFLARLTAKTEELRIGDPFDPSTDLGPVISEPQLSMMSGSVERAVATGATVVTGGHALTDAPFASGCFYPPTILVGVDPDSEIAQTEVFGPIVTVFPVSDLDHAVRLANGTDYGLSAGICTRSMDAAEEFVRRSDSGVVSVNAATAGIEVQAPLKGTKGSGLGPAEQGQEVLDFYSRTKAVYQRMNGVTA